MTQPIDPHRFVDKQLVAKAAAENDFVITVDGLAAGRIMLRPVSGGRSEWLWSITGPGMAQAGLASSGTAESLQEARQGFRKAFDRWLAWALQHDGRVWWFG